MSSIAIIGGGPGGLTLAKLLAVHGVRSTVFELDASPTARPQGGSLDLHSASGLRALELAGLTDGFRRVARYEDQGARVCDKAGTLLYEEAHSELGGRPEIDRGELRALLVDSLPAETIAWGHAITEVEPLADGRVRVGFADRESQVFDLVVGADGTWSRVRPVVSDVRPLYTGVSFVELEIDDLDTTYPDIAAMVGHGKMLALSDQKALIAQRNARSNLRVYVARHAPEGWARELAATPAAAIKADLEALLADWSPRLRAFISHARDRALALPLYALPIGDRWTHRRGVTLLGDAAHVMSPFAGEGVNNAMRDATELALAIAAAAAADRDAAVARYEAEMFERIVDSAVESAAGLEIAMAPTAAAQMVALMRSHAPPPPAGA